MGRWELHTKFWSENLKAETAWQAQAEMGGMSEIILGIHKGPQDEKD
jgi:hypothetical protein